MVVIHIFKTGSLPKGFRNKRASRINICHEHLLPLQWWRIIFLVFVNQGNFQTETVRWLGMEPLPLGRVSVQCGNQAPLLLRYMGKGHPKIMHYVGRGLCYYCTTLEWGPSVTA